MVSTGNLQGLYLVTPDWDDTAQLLSITEAALQGGAKLLQYRHKTAGPVQRREQASALQALAQRYSVPFIINDWLDLCQQLNADGLHIGGTDASVAQARAQLGPDKIIGASCYGDIHLAQQAALAGASYLALGGFYPSRVKKYPVTTAPELIAQVASQFALPVVVIGGMTPENAAPLVAQGAHMVAAISSVYGSDAANAQAAAQAAAQVAAQAFGRLWAA
jgi:thiamine-phosphate pyrophosphorylase